MVDPEPSKQNTRGRNNPGWEVSPSQGILDKNSDLGSVSIANAGTCMFLGGRRKLENQLGKIRTH